MTSAFLNKNSYFWHSIYCMSAAFLTYCSMYAFRKPISSGVFESNQLWGVDYKIILITAQAIGYTISKFAGIKLISEMKSHQRISYILILLGISWFGLFLFATLGFPWGTIGLFINGLPLGMIWGIVFSFLEGRRNTELLGVGMSVSFIIASGLVKSIGRFLIDQMGVSEFWMPFCTGILFILPLLIGVWMLSKIPPPTTEDKMARTERVPMNYRERMSFFRSFAPGIALLVCVYVALTILRDLRDNFSVELWNELGFENTSRLLTLSEIPIAILVFLIVASMILIKNNRIAFMTNIIMIMSGGALLLISTFLHLAQLISPIMWMISIGFAMYLSYISYHTMLFERWIAAFKYQSNIGFLMYLADSFGYLGSVCILFLKNFGRHSTSWLKYIELTTYVTGTSILILGLLSLIYFEIKFRKIKTQSISSTETRFA